MSKKRKLLIISSFIIIDILLIGGILFFRNNTNRNVLSNEVNSVLNYDIFNDDINNKVKSRGNYALVEKAIKDYFYLYSIDIKNVKEKSFDVKLNSLLFPNKLKEDMPLYDDTILYIDTYQDNINNSYEELSYFTINNDINKFINKYTDDKEIIELYENILKKNKINDKINDINNELVIDKISINCHIDSIKKVILFLRDNNGNYDIVNNEVKFNDDLLNSEYLKLLDKVK